MDEDGMEIVVGYCSLCRSYERDNYSMVINEVNEKHFTACKESKCSHPVFYIADLKSNTISAFPVETIEKIFTEDPEASFDDLIT